MIKYNLNCECGYSFDSWFASSLEYERLKAKHFLKCSFCQSQNIKKSIMSPNLKSKSNKLSKNLGIEKGVKNKLIEIKKYIQKNCKDVGERFVHEARNIHYDKKTSKGIYGKATPEETKELLDEGIEVSLIPWIESENNEN